MLTCAACSSGVSQRPAGALKKVEVVDAINRQALCMDGSPISYYLQAGSGVGVDTWVIHLEGGGRCATLAECQVISSPFRSSQVWESSLLGQGILSDIYSENPFFYQSNHVLLRQCSADGWIGTNFNNQSFNFLGSVSFKAIIQDLISNKGLDQAAKVLLAGASSGTQGVLQHLDWLAAKLPQAQVKGVMDAGYTMDVPVYQNLVTTVSTRIQQYYLLHHSFVDVDCAALNAANIQRCLLPEVVISNISSPLMIKDSQYDNVVLSKYGVSLPYDVQEQAYVDQYVISLKASLSTQPFVYSDSATSHTALATKGYSRRKIGQIYLYNFLGEWFFQGVNTGSIVE
ncbi:MAG: pectinacetylesterase family protein [Ghiorsea sp.]|nr:pectinacetylesterase family protein [Ghiorsea sp.]